MDDIENSDEDLAAAFNDVFNTDDNKADDVAGDDLPIEEPENTDAETKIVEPELTEYQKLEQLFNARLKEETAAIEAKLEERYQKVTGKLGEFNRKLLDAQNTGKSFNVTKEDLASISENFGEDFAEALASDLSKLKGAGSDAGSDTLKEYMASIDDRQNDFVISTKHKDWKNEIKTDDFAEFYGKLSPEAQKDSDNPVEIIELLDHYKELKTLENDKTFKSWKDSLGVDLPSDKVVSTYNGWKELSQLDGFPQWANQLTDESTRYRIGRDADAKFMKAAKEAFLDYQGLRSQKTITSEPKRVNKRIESAILPNTSSDYADKGGNSLEDFFLSAFED